VLVSPGENGPIPRISTEELVALNEEIAALVRAGIPLEVGLRELGEDLPGRLGSLATHIGDRLERGEQLTDILASDPHAVPRLWGAVVAAGVKSGHLAAALEGMAATGRRVAELRRGVALAFMYPLIVAGLAYVMLILTLTYYIPIVQSARDGLTSVSNVVLDRLGDLGQSVSLWAPWPPILVAVGLIYLWWRSGRVAWTTESTEEGRGRSETGGWPSVFRVLREGRAATFAELLALMNDQRVPLHDAVVLAADASGDRGLREAARTVSDQLRRGETGSSGRLPSAFPPLIGWSLFAGVETKALTETLRNSARLYRERAARTARWAILYLPIFLTVVIGGTAVLVQTLAVFIPLSQLLYDLGQ
jgi:general secretion pathway protein F